MKILFNLQSWCFQYASHSSPPRPYIMRWRSQYQSFGGRPQGLWKLKENCSIRSPVYWRTLRSEESFTAKPAYFLYFALDQQFEQVKVWGTNNMTKPWWLTLSRCESETSKSLEIFYDITISYSWDWPLESTFQWRTARSTTPL